jgi:NADH:ubiquinone oxidoreductase subunit F (NADH-binding)
MVVPFAARRDARYSAVPSVGAVSVGARHARLLAGPRSTTEPESLAGHLDRLGPLEDDHHAGERLRALVRAAGLVGRGGGEFPLAQKLDLAARSPGVPLVVVNASESEPASRKDQTLLRLRPHLVLDGAAVVASAVGAEVVFIYVHVDRPHVSFPLEWAIEERRRAGLREPRYVVAKAPARYVAGESSAVVAFLDAGIAMPRRRAVPAAAGGVAGRPTVVSNTETYAHVALLERFGVSWFRSAGSAGTPGSTLLTLAGDVPNPGAVVELLGPAAVGEVLTDVAALAAPPRALLIGGYAGTWVDGTAAWRAPLDRATLRRAGIPLGCGVLAVLSGERCGLAETARLIGWLAGQSSGQCGPCVSGLPAIAGHFDELVCGRARARDVSRLRRLAVAVRGRGACGHPTGVAALLESAFDTFDEEVREHVRGRSCEALGAGLPLPAVPSGSRR